MATITIREVPDPILESLKRKAAMSGLSIEAYVLDLLVHEVAKSRLAEMMDRLDHEASAHLEVRDVIDAGRADA